MTERFYTVDGFAISLGEHETVSESDLGLLVTKLKRSYPMASYQTKEGEEYMELYTHELAHLVDAFPKYDVATHTNTLYQMDGVSGLLRKKYTKNYASDGNEIRASAITIHTLCGYEGFAAEDSEESMYGNVRADFERTQSRFVKALCSQSCARSARRIQAFYRQVLQG